MTAHGQLAFEPDVIILDLMLPDGLGHSLIRHLRTIDHPARVVVTTGMSNARELAEVRSLGVVAILQKPIDFQALLGHL